MSDEEINALCLEAISYIVKDQPFALAKIETTILCTIPGTKSNLMANYYKSVILAQGKRSIEAVNLLEVSIENYQTTSSDNLDQELLDSMQKALAAAKDFLASEN